MPSDRTRQDAHYAEAGAAFAPAIARLARSVEADADQARDLEQEIHLALWRSLAGFDGRCALSTWVYRVAHNVAASHVARRARGAKLVALDDADLLAADDIEAEVGVAQTIARLHALIRRLHSPDREVILLYLEGLDARAIAEVTGLATGTVAVKVHRIKALLARRFHSGEAA
ncbi:RNA polymerase sigma-70 factor (ECF subfamily) [Sphingomonas naasensis]|uniref:Sigma-70 family RNA polymerase sigma factor n=1 Tax=Sphingomonas naasensis TaxID=1344951 RepID=A0A4S1W7S4_9SPHN|nr:sigma-70 family RNA polymerase sigma factor [Sphingomonas naasensis]NIJ19627.1 RNA polymerase sigma-70 factor (ECF subfamily) [Sphingomonas naasensis]TGX37297.1 sigma-70 family RNA polymerase sigma factor [Sphingomonas naasensis]